MKHKIKRHADRWLACLLCFLMAVSMMGTMAFAAPDENGLCGHHTAHTEECGYQEAQDARPCTHVHDENCGYQEELGEESCTHIHDESCGYAEAADASPCTFVCSQCSQTNDTGDTDDTKISGDTKDLKGSPAPQNTDFTAGRSITYYAAASDNEYFGVVSDYKADGATFSSWEKTFTAEATYSEKTVSPENAEPFCSFVYTTENVNWGDGAESTYCLTKTYNAAVPDSEVVAENYEANTIVMPFNGKGSSFLGYRFYAYNTEPDGSGTWYRCGQTLPEGVTELYAQFCSALSLASQITALTKEAKAGINMNGTENAYTATDPYIIKVADGKLSENALYYTAYLDMGEVASRMSWARMDKLDLSPDNTSVELTVNFDPRLDLFSGSDTFTFQYTGGFSPYQDGQFLSPDAGTVCTYTLTMDKDDMPDNTLTLKLGLNATGYAAPDLTLKDFSQMTLTVSGQQGAKAVIPETLAEKAADAGVTDETDESFIKTDGKVTINVKPDGYSAQNVTLTIDPVYAQLRKAETVTLTPQDMVAYTGGDSISGDNFPSVRYQIDAPGGVNPEDITFSVDGKTCKPEKAGDYYLLSDVANTFISQDGAAGSDAAENDAVAGVYDIGIENETALAATSSAGVLSVDVADAGTLTVRNVSAPDAVIDETLDVAQPVVSDAQDVNTDDDIGMAVIPEDTEFYTNGDDSLGLLGDDDSEHPQIALLFDDILPGEEGEDTAQLLTDRADTAGYTLTDDNSEFKYLDLINENDGNAWVSAEDGSSITIYWPCPAGVTAQDNEVEVLHFKGLHREYRGDIEDQVSNSDVEVIDAKIENGNIVFQLTGNQTEGSFSPFAIHWTAKKSTDDNNDGSSGSQGTQNGSGAAAGNTGSQNSSNTGKTGQASGSAPQTGVSANIALWLALLAVSGAGVTSAFIFTRRRQHGRGRRRR